jgi:hypothetical protein
MTSSFTATVLLRNRACATDRSLEYDEKRSVSRDSFNLYAE